MPACKLFTCLFCAILFLVPLSMLDHDVTAPEPEGRGAQPLQDTDRLQESISGGAGFVENQGQITESQVRFSLQIHERAYWFTDSGYLMTMTDREGRTTTVSIEFLDANPVVPIGTGKGRHRSTYITGNQPSAWITHVPSFSGLLYDELYPGIDLLFHLTDTGLKYDLNIAPGGAPSLIELAYDGILGLHLHRGDLIIRTQAGELVERAPVSYQRSGGFEQVVPSSYSLSGNIVGFQVGNYDTSRTLVIDPLIYSTYVGGTFGDMARSMVLDSNKNVYVCGESSSYDFPTTPESHNRSLNLVDIVVFKLNDKGTELLYSTFIGGSDYEACVDLAIDRDDNIYIVGDTRSTDFPVTDGALDREYSGDPRNTFVAKLNSTGSGLLYATYFGKGEYLYSSSIAVDDDNNAYVLGLTHSNEALETTFNAFDRDPNGDVDCFAFKLDPAGAELLYLTYLGGNSIDACQQLTLDDQDNVYITGYTRSEDFPISDQAFGRTHSADGAYQVFVSKLNMSENGPGSLEYSTFIGKGLGYHIAVDEDHNAYLTGRVGSKDFPTTEGAHRTEFDMSDGDAFALKLNHNGTDVLASTFLGGNGTDIGYGIDVDADGGVFVTGETWADFTFPTTPDGYDTSPNGQSDAFVVRLNPDLSRLTYSSFMGGTYFDAGMAIVVDPDLADTVYVAGYTHSPDLPVSEGALDLCYNGVDDIIIFKLSPSKPLPRAVIKSISPAPARVGATVTFIANGTSNGTLTGYSWTSSLDGELYNGSKAEFSTDTLSPGRHTVWLKVKDDQNGWSESVVGSLLVNGTMEPNLLPTLFISSPVDDTIISGVVPIEGQASDGDGTVTRVEVGIDGQWWMASGTDNWSWSWDTTQLDNQEIELQARAYDGTDYSAIARSTVTIDNPVHERLPEFLTLVQGMIVDEGPFVGVRTHLFWTVYNNGDGDGKVQVQVYIDSLTEEAMIWNETHTLDRAGSRLLAAPWTPEREGATRIIVVLTDRSATATGDETPGLVSKEIEVRPYPTANRKDDAGMVPTPLSPTMVVVYVGLAGGIFLGLMVGVETFRYRTLLAFFPLYSRLSKDEIERDLSQQTIRGRIYQHIIENPGTHFSRILRHVKAGNGTTCYHLDILERQSLVRSMKRGTRKYYFKAGLSPPYKFQARIAFTGLNILNLLSGGGEYSVGQIAEQIKRSNATTSYNLKSLERKAFVESHKDQQFKYCRITGKGQQYIEEHQRRDIDQDPLDIEVDQ